MNILMYLLIALAAMKILAAIFQCYMRGKNKREAKALMREYPQQAVEIWKALQISEAASAPVATQGGGGGLSKLLVIVLAVAYFKPDLSFLIDAIPGLRWCYDIATGIIEFKKLFT